MFKISVTSILLILLAGCSSSPEVQIPENIAQLENLTVISESEAPGTINFKREAVYGDTEDVIIGRISSVAIDENGRVFIADGDQNVIHVYEPGGNYLTRLGREGEGPGEFGNIGNLNRDSQYLYAYDWNQRKLNVFSLEDLGFSHTIPLLREDRDIEELSGTYPGQYYVRNDGTLLVGYNQPYRSNDLDEKRTTKYYLLDKEGRVTSDKFFEHNVTENLTDRSNNSFMVMYSPFGRKPLFSLAGDDRIYYCWTEDFLVKIYNPDGSYERAFYYPYSKAPLDRDEILSRYEGERQRRMVRNADAPATWPALNSLTVDNKNRMWVSTITDDQDVYDWRIIDEEGEILAQFTWPRDQLLEEVKDNYVYTRETDEETDLQQISRYRMEIM